MRCPGQALRLRWPLPSPEGPDSASVPSRSSRSSTRGARERGSRVSAQTRNVLHKADQRAIEIGSIADQLVIAADLKPRKFRTKWQRAVYDGPTARRDAELAERERWVQLLANIYSDRQTLQWED